MLSYIQLLRSLQNPLQVSPPEPTSGQMLPNTLGNLHQSEDHPRTLMVKYISLAPLLLQASRTQGLIASSWRPKSLDQCLVHRRVSVKACGIKVTTKQLLQIESYLCALPRFIVSCDPPDNPMRQEASFF